MIESMDTHTDYQLVRAYLDGDMAAFDTLYERCRLPLFSYLNKRMVQHPDAVDDLFQQTWSKAIKHLPRFRDANFMPWLLRIAHNTAIDHIRKVRPSDPLEDHAAELHSAELAPGATLMQHELIGALRSAVDTLPPEQREVVSLRQTELGFNEIASIQQCSINTTMGRMRYALAALRKALAPIRNGAREP